MKFTNNDLVRVYYCECGKSIQCASHPDLLDLSKAQSDDDKKHIRANIKDFKQADNWGRRVETITISEYRDIPFMCSGVEDCPKKQK